MKSSINNFVTGQIGKLMEVGYKLLLKLETPTKKIKTSDEEIVRFTNTDSEIESEEDDSSSIYSRILEDKRIFYILGDLKLWKKIFGYLGVEVKNFGVPGFRNNCLSCGYIYPNPNFNSIPVMKNNEIKFCCSYLCRDKLKF